MDAPASLRRTLGDLVLPWPLVRTLAWGMIAVPFTLPSVAWELGWVRPPETPQQEEIVRRETPPIEPETTAATVSDEPAKTTTAADFTPDVPVGSVVDAGSKGAAPSDDAAKAPARPPSPWMTSKRVLAQLRKSANWQTAKFRLTDSGTHEIKITGAYNVRCTARLDDAGSPIELIDCKDLRTETAETADIKSTSIPLNCFMIPDRQRCTGRYVSKRDGVSETISLSRLLSTK